MTNRHLALIGTWGFAAGIFVGPFLVIVSAELFDLDLATVGLYLILAVVLPLILGLVGLVAVIGQDVDHAKKRRRRDD